MTPTTITVDSLFGSAVTVTTDSSTAYSEGGKKVVRGFVVAAIGASRSASPGSAGRYLELERLLSASRSWRSWSRRCRARSSGWTGPSSSSPNRTGRRHR